jgi:hypothetical protein
MQLKIMQGCFISLVISTVIFILFISGCVGQPQETWVLKNVPTTPEEQKAVADHVNKVLSAFPSKVSGDDQDLEDVVEATYARACQVLCRPSLWKYNCYNGQFTGEWKYVEFKFKDKIEEEKSQ